MQFLVVNSDGSRTVKGDPGWLTGDTPETARACTPDELVALGYGLKVIDEKPAYNPGTQVCTAAPIDQWVLTETTATIPYTVTDLTIEQIREAMPEITPRQLRLTLLSINITESQVDAALVNDAAGTIEWKYATRFKRTHPLISALIPTFNLTEEQVDSLWLYAADIE